MSLASLGVMPVLVAGCGEGGTAAHWRVASDDLDLELDAAKRRAYAEAELDGPDVRFRRFILDGLIQLPADMPAYTEMRVSADGHLWVKRFRPPWERLERWGVFAPDGVFLGDIELPENLRITEVGNDYVLAIATDTLDVERVNLHRIRR